MTKEEFINGLRIDGNRLDFNLIYNDKNWKYVKNELYGYDYEEIIKHMDLIHRIKINPYLHEEWIKEHASGLYMFYVPIRLEQVGAKSGLVAIRAHPNSDDK